MSEIKEKKTNLLKKITHVGKIVLLTLSLTIFITSSGYLYSGGNGYKLIVSLYKYVPRLPQFKRVILNKWKKVTTQCALEFVDWDCYRQDPTPELHVFAFDSTFLNYFTDREFLRPIRKTEIAKITDIMPYALTGSTVGSSIMALPQIACTEMMFCRKDDPKSLQYLQAKTLQDLYQLIGDNPSSLIPPPAGQGLLMDLSGSTTCAMLYIKAFENFTGMYSLTPPLPLPTNLNPTVIGTLRSLVRMGGLQQVQYIPTESYQRARWFSQGSGKAMVAYSESLCVMPKEVRNNMCFKVMPFGDNPLSLFYLDMIGINPKIHDPALAGWALELANMITSTEVIVECLGPDLEDPTPQFILPVRDSCFQVLGTMDPIYKDLRQVVMTCEPLVYRLGGGSRDWLEKYRKAIQAVIFDLKAQEKKPQEKKETIK